MAARASKRLIAAAALAAMLVLWGALRAPPRRSSATARTSVHRAGAGRGGRIIRLLGIGLVPACRRELFRRGDLLGDGTVSAARSPDRRSRENTSACRWPARTSTLNRAATRSTSPSPTTLAAKRSKAAGTRTRTSSQRPKHPPDSGRRQKPPLHARRRVPPRSRCAGSPRTALVSRAASSRRSAATCGSRSCAPACTGRRHELPRRAGAGAGGANVVAAHRWPRAGRYTVSVSLHTAAGCPLASVRRASAWRRERRSSRCSRMHVRSGRGQRLEPEPFQDRAALARRVTCR